MSSLAVQALRLHLEVLRQINTNALTEESPLALQPPHIQLPLRVHQLAALHAMRKKEVELRQTGLEINANQRLYSDYCILGDRVGVGKTLTVLGHISQCVREGLEESPPLQTLHPASGPHCFSLSTDPSPEYLFNNLIVVPHTIYKQWQEAILTHTNLVPLFLKTLRDLDKDSLLTNLQHSDCALISNTLLHSLLQSLHAREIQPVWRRIFYDEADTIKIKSTCPKPQARMTWFISATYTSLLFSNSYYHSYICRQMPEEFIQQLDTETKQYYTEFTQRHPTVSFFRTESYPFFSQRLEGRHPLRGHLVIRNSPAFLDMSIQLPPLHRSIIYCETPNTYRILQHAIPSEAQSALHAGDIQGALQILGCNQHTPLTLVDAATAFKRKELERLQRLLEFKESSEYATPQAKEQAIASTREKIQRLQDQLQIIEQRLQEVSRESCTICFDSAANPCVTPCCSRTFCGGCILEWFTRATTCPMCRAAIHPNQLLSLQTSTNAANLSIYHKPKKMEALLQLLEENPAGKFLIFSRFENTFATIQNSLGDRFPIGVLQGNKDVVGRMLQSFEKGDLSALLVSSRNAAAGIHIPSATHIILLHRMNQEEEIQILGRAYRLGRTSPLTCVSLLHEKE